MTNTKQDVSTESVGTQPSDIQAVTWPILIAALFGIAALNLGNTTVLNLIAHCGLVGIVVLHVRKKNSSSWQQASLLAGIAGGVAGFLVALYKLIVWFNLIYVFNLATQSIFAGVLDAIAAGFLFLIVESVQNTTSTKGGEKND